MRRYLLLLCAVCLFIAVQSVFAQDDALPLEQEFSSDLMTFQYPEGWVAEDLELIVMLATDEESLESADNLGDSQARITLIVGDMADFGVPRRATLDEAREAIEDFTRERVNREEPFLILKKTAHAPQSCFMSVVQSITLFLCGRLMTRITR